MYKKAGILDGFLRFVGGGTRHSVDSIVPTTEHLQQAYATKYGIHSPVAGRRPIPGGRVNGPVILGKRNNILREDLTRALDNLGYTQDRAYFNKNMLDEYRAKALQYGADNKQLRGQLTRTSDDLQRTAGNLRGASARAANATAGKALWQDKALRQGVEIKNLNDAVEGLRGNVTRSQDRAANAVRRGDNYRETALGLGVKNKELTGRVNDLTGQVSDLSARNKDLADIMKYNEARHEFAINRANKDMADLRAANNDLRGNVSDLTAKRRGNIGHAVRYKGKYMEAQDKVNSLTGQVGDLTGNLDTANSRIASLTGDLAAANERIGGLQKDLVGALNERTNAVVEANNARATSMRMVEQLEKAEKSRKAAANASNRFKKAMRGSLLKNRRLALLGGVGAGLAGIGAGYYAGKRRGEED